MGDSSSASRYWSRPAKRVSVLSFAPAARGAYALRDKGRQSQGVSVRCTDIDFQKR